MFNILEEEKLGIWQSQTRCEGLKKWIAIRNENKKTDVMIHFIFKIKQPSWSNGYDQVDEKQELKSP